MGYTVLIGTDFRDFIILHFLYKIDAEITISLTDARTKFGHESITHVVCLGYK